MPLSPDPHALRKLVVIAICASLSVVLGIVEALIPFAVTIPGAKLGLGNILVLTCLVCLGGRDALWLIVLKTLLTAFILGSFSTFLFSM
ncbi:heptaprenyl diphosphate synthase, partial [Clostridium perfringens]